jgi:RhoGAP domain
MISLTNYCNVDGLLVLEGRPTDVRRWRHLVENGNACPAFQNNVQPAVVATLLREWLLSLPEPIFTWDLSPSFLACRSLESQSDHLMSSVIRLIGLLPHQNQVLASQLIQLFAILCKRSSKKVVSG